MKQWELDAIVETIGDKMGDSITLPESAIGFSEFKGVVQENNLPMGLNLYQPKIGKYDSELAIIGVMNGKRCVAPLNIKQNEGVLVATALQVFSMEVESYTEFVELAKTVSRDLISTYEQGSDIYMSERIPGWGAFKVKESSN